MGNPRIPRHELGLLNDLITAAEGLATAGRLADGYSELAYGLERAEAVRRLGLQWGAGLIRCYDLAVERYCRRYGVPL